MTENTKIEWADHTFNPWWGCQKVSPACDNCYAEALDKRTGGGHWGPKAERRRTSLHNWVQPLKWDRAAAKTGTRPRVFCASMADIGDNAVPQQWRDDLANLIRMTPNLDWLLLTKRPQNLVKFYPADVLKQCWIGTTVENQTEAERRIPALLNVPARLRFLSCEPLLEKIKIENYGTGASISWVICGGESGPNARPMHPDWARSLRDQCVAADIPFFFKQWGQWHSDALLNTDARTGECPPAKMKVGKKIAGRLLDGREWNEIPGKFRRVEK